MYCRCPFVDKRDATQPVACAYDQQPAKFHVPTFGCKCSVKTMHYVLLVSLSSMFHCGFIHQIESMEHYHSWSDIIFSIM
jgi:hypothetical protein